jgi:hypothetical protein
MVNIDKGIILLVICHLKTLAFYQKKSPRNHFSPMIRRGRGGMGS